MNTELQLEILQRVQHEIAEAQAEGHVIVDDWFPFDDDLDVNIWTDEGVTHAWVYPKNGDDIGTEIFSERLTWRIDMVGQEFHLRRDDKGELEIMAFCQGADGAEHLVDIAWCINTHVFEYIAEQLP